MSVSTHSGRIYSVVRKLDSADASVCALLNRLSRGTAIRNLFRAVSRLGDGVIWYSLMALLPVIGGHDGLVVTLHMGLTALAGLFIYKITKRYSGRERPYVRHAGQVACAMPPLDRYSFPSGHTLHAVSFTLVLCSYFPQMIWVLLPFALLVALSRMILGLHYPSDVLAGAMIGGILALLSFNAVELLGLG
ncbi:MAG: phosphatase PAP2 family protein [Gammaproteobacteria bacterium]